MGEIKYRAAEEMKDSGTNWIGEIPKEWIVTTVKHYYDVRLGKMLQPDKKSSSDKLEKYFCTLNIDWQSIKLTLVKEMWISKTERSIYKVRNGDLLVNEGGDAGKSCVLKNINEDIYFQNSIHRVRNKSNSSIKFLYYWMFYLKSLEYIELICNKATIIHFTYDKFNNLLLIKPDNLVQQKIAKFLDIKTAQFDSIISKKEQLIQKLEEAKKSLISEVVTGKVKIVDGEMVIRQPEEMKDSGVEWLRKIPKDWLEVKLSYISANMTDGAHVSPEIEDGMYPFLSVKDLKDNSLDFQNCLLTSTKSYRYLSRNACNPNVGDVLISKDGSIGKTTVIDYKREFVVASSLIIITPLRGINSYYMQYALNSNFFQKQIQLHTKGAALPRVSIIAMKNCKLLISRNSDTQEQIVLFLDKKAKQINESVSKVKSQIQKLKQAKQSLISETVTGKIDLRDWQIIEEGE